MKEDLERRIREARLTKTGEILANFITAHTEDVCFLTSTRLAAAAGVSEASVVRFTRMLGYDGYIDFQRCLREQYRESENPGSGGDGETGFDFSGSLMLRDTAERDFLAGFYQGALRKIQSFFDQNSWAALEEAAMLLTRSSRKFIVASRANSGVGGSCFLMLRNLLPDVYYTASVSASAIDFLSDAQPGDCILAFCFPRYSNLDLLALEMARHAGARIVVITDRQGSSPSRFAHLTLTVDVQTDLGFNSYTGVRFAMELLCACISRKIGAGNEEKLRNIDRYLGQLTLY